MVAHMMEIDVSCGDAAAVEADDDELIWAL